MKPQNTKSSFIWEHHKIPKNLKVYDIHERLQFDKNYMVLGSSVEAFPEDTVQIENNQIIHSLYSSKYDFIQNLEIDVSCVPKHLNLKYVILTYDDYGPVQTIKVTPKSKTLMFTYPFNVIPLIFYPKIGIYFKFGDGNQNSKTLAKNCILLRYKTFKLNAHEIYRIRNMTARLGPGVYFEGCKCIFNSTLFDTFGIS
uniref:Uncharacterized protein n=1 Tax=viral metagenome TaxID=1070528 RepID=A0A6C0CMU3_9ZZZZ